MRVLISTALVIAQLISLPVWAEETTCPPSFALLKIDEIKLGASAPATSGSSLKSAPRPTFQSTTALPQLRMKQPNSLFKCRREFEYQNRLFALDSFHKQDAEKLRPLLSDLPDAVSELDAYQSNRRVALKSAYVGSIGLFVAVASMLVAGFLPKKPDGNPTTAATVTRNVGMILGFGTAIGSFGVTFMVLQSNESRVSRAVQMHNEARPTNPIELQFNTGILF